MYSPSTCGQGRGRLLLGYYLDMQRYSSLVDVLHDALWGYSSGRPILLKGGQATPEASTAMARFAECQRRDERDMKNAADHNLQRMWIVVGVGGNNDKRWDQAEILKGTKKLSRARMSGSRASQRARLPFLSLPPLGPL